MTTKLEFTGTIDIDAGTFEGTITGQVPPVEPPPIDPPVEPPPVEPPTGQPGAVTDLAAEASGADAVTLSWTPVAGATKYNIQGSPDGQMWSDIGQSRRPIYVAEGLQAATQYWARIFAENSSGEWGQASNVATVTTEASDTPVPPTQPPSGGDTDLSRLAWAPDWRAKQNGWSVGNESGMAATDAVIDKSVMLGDHPSARDDIKYGDQGWEDPVRKGGYVGMHQSPGSLKEGDEMWFRIWQRTSAGFNHAADQGPVTSNSSTARKCLRLSGGAQRVDFQYVGEDKEVWDWDRQENRHYNAGSWHVAWEGTQKRFYLDLTGRFFIPDLTWVCTEGYVKFSNNSNVGKMRLWQGGEQVGTTVTAKTSYINSGDSLTSMFINFWNSGAPKDQTMWWARPAIAIRKANGSRDDTRYMDSCNGFPFIGLAI